MVYTLNLLREKRVSRVQRKAGRGTRATSQLIYRRICQTGSLRLVLSVYLPVTRSIVLGDVTSGLGHVNVERARVLDRSIDSKANSVTGSDLVGLGLGTGSKTTSVADEILGGDIGNGGVHVAVLANILVLLGDLRANDELVEAVVSHCGLGQGGGSHDSSEGTHLDVYTARLFLENGRWWKE
jgi:hypothetical protein